MTSSLLGFFSAAAKAVAPAPFRPTPEDPSPVSASSMNKKLQEMRERELEKRRAKQAQSGMLQQSDSDLKRANSGPATQQDGIFAQQAGSSAGSSAAQQPVQGTSATTATVGAAAAASTAGPASNTQQQQQQQQQQQSAAPVGPAGGAPATAFGDAPATNSAGAASAAAVARSEAERQAAVEHQQREHAAPVSPMSGQNVNELERELMGRGVSTSYDPNEGRPDPREIDLSDMRVFLHRPCPKGKQIQCFIRREKGGLMKQNRKYFLYLQDGNRFLLAAKKRKRKKSSNYLISSTEGDLARASDAYFGKVRSNFMGTEFSIYDHGRNPTKIPGKDDGASAMMDLRKELGCIFYDTNILGSKGPRKMRVVVPTVDGSGNATVFQPTSDKHSLAAAYKANEAHQDLITLRNKQPVWNDTSHAYVLNFSGRVTMASVKNFQLISPDVDADYIILQFGRTGRDTFTMDVQYPLSPYQAFAIVLSSFDSKLACE